MTGLEIYTQFDKLVGEEGYEKTHAYQLLTQAKNYIETYYKLKILEALDQSQTANPGETYLSTKDLPDDWKSTNKLVVGILSYWPVPFSKRIQWRNSARRFYIDYRNKKFALCGAIATGQTINHFYQVRTEDLNESNENDNNIIVWPDEFQPIIAYQAAKILEANINADEIAFRMSAAQEVEYQRLLDSLIAWDQDLKIAELNGALGYSDEYADFPIDIGLL